MKPPRPWVRNSAQLADLGDNRTPLSENFPDGNNTAEDDNMNRLRAIKTTPVDSDIHHRSVDRLPGQKSLGHRQSPIDSSSTPSSLPKTPAPTADRLEFQQSTSDSLSQPQVDSGSLSSSVDRFPLCRSEGSRESAPDRLPIIQEENNYQLHRRVGSAPKQKHRRRIRFQ